MEFRTQSLGSDEGEADLSPLQGPRSFPTTEWTMVLEACHQDSPQAERALEKLCRTYWYPLYSFVRRSGYSPQEAQDLTQSFFAHLLEKNLLAKVRRERGRFRSFLLACLKNFLSLERQKAQAQKRGGDQQFLFLDVESAEARLDEEPAEVMTPERVYTRSWALTVLEEAFRQIEKDYRDSGKEHLFERLKPFLLGKKMPVTYAEVAKDLEATEGAIKMMVKRLRERYRHALRSVVASTVPSSEQIDAELRELLEELRQ